MDNETKNIDKPALYLAPMEEVTGYIFRNVLNQLFGGVDKYYSPFITPTDSMKLKPREIKDISRDNNMDLYLVPQLLTNDAELFVKGVELLSDRGFKEINLNLGCPSNTVAKKGKGSGFLRFPDSMDKFFDEVFNRIDEENLDVEISVKTRIGMKDKNEFFNILPIYNRYPISELIIHPRVKEDMYSNDVKMDIFDYAYNESRIKLCFNGDVCTIEDANNIMTKYPEANIMIGRGAVANPSLFREIRLGEHITNDELLVFHNRLYEDYKEALGPKDAFFKMKEVWNNMRFMFDNEKLAHKIRISKTPEEMLLLANKMINEEKIVR